MFIWAMICTSFLAKPAAQAQTVVARTPNEYYALLALRDVAARRIATDIRFEHARRAADRLERHAAKVKALSFSASDRFFWTIHGSPASYRPMAEWKNEDFVEAQMVSAPDGHFAAIQFKGKPLYQFFLHGESVDEFKYPFNGIGGQVAHYAKGGRSIRLREGVSDDPLLMCCIASYVNRWAGPDAPAVKKIADAVRRGEWVGTVASPGKPPVDVIVLVTDPDEKDGQWNAYYIDADGFLVKRLSIRHVEGYERFNRIVWVSTHTDYSTQGVSGQRFLPSEELLKTARSWRRISPEESLTAQKR